MKYRDSSGQVQGNAHEVEDMEQVQLTDGPHQTPLLCCGALQVTCQGSGCTASAWIMTPAGAIVSRGQKEDAGDTIFLRFFLEPSMVEPFPLQHLCQAPGLPRAVFATCGPRCIRTPRGLLCSDGCCGYRGRGLRHTLHVTRAEEP